MNKIFTGQNGEMQLKSSMFTRLGESGKAVFKKTGRRHLLLLAFALLFTASSAPAFAQSQNITVKGIVVDASDKLPMPGVSVTDAQRKALALTGADGSFSVSIPAGGQLSFTMLGYTIATRTYSASQDRVTVEMTASTSELNEVVVTALGIKREQKALGFATQTLDESELNDARSNNWTSALSGKVAGLNVISPGSGPLNSANIILRGERSTSSNKNSALIVVDGIPVSGGLTGSGVGSAYGAGAGNDIPVDFGNGISDLNPDDIESVTVLKGAGATALYGSRAGNGALIITTKSGKKRDKGLGITFNSNYSFNDVLRWPDYQYEYGQGTGTTLTPAANLYYSYQASADGANTGGTSSAFGPKFNGQSYFQYDPKTGGQSATRVPWVPYKDNIKGFWQNGYTLTNSISLDGGNEKATARASVTHSKNEWIMPNTGYERLSAALNMNFNPSNKLRISSKINFTNKRSDNLPGTGYNNQSISYFMIFQNPNVDLNWYRPIWKPGQVEVDQIHPFSSFIDNPFLIAHEMINSVNSYKTIANLSASYDITPKLSFMIRSGFDMNNEDRAQERPYSTANFMRGYFKQQNFFYFEQNTDALLSYKTAFGKDFDLNISAGANALNYKYTGVNRSVDGLVIPGVYKLSNGVNNPSVNNDYRRKKVHSVYGSASFGWKDRIFVDVTGRNDWSSTLPVKNNSFFYPSVSSSFIISELFTLPEVITYTKLRLSVAQAGNDTDPYSTDKYYGISEFPSSGSVPNILYNPNLKPEITTSYEAGLEHRMFKSRLGIDLTYYDTRTENQIIEIVVDQTSGYGRALINQGEIANRGWEVLLTGKPVDGKNFKWSTSVNWSKNQNEVLGLPSDLQQVIGTAGNASIIAKNGGTTGDIYGFGFVRAPDGQIVYTAAGLPARPAEIQYIGNAYPAWRGGITNDFQYKNYRFSIQFDGQKGGTVYSQTHHKMMEQGKLTKSIPGREEGFIIGPGVVLNSSGQYVPNTTKVAPASFYGDYYRRANVESNSFDASFIKLREVRLEWGVPAKLVQKLKLNQASFALYGRDLALFTKFPVFDPETATLNGSTTLPGAEIGQMPSMRTFGMNLTLKF